MAYEMYPTPTPEQAAARRARSVAILQDGIEQSRRAAADDPVNAAAHDANADALAQQVSEILDSASPTAAGGSRQE